MMSKYLQRLATFSLKLFMHNTLRNVVTLYLVVVTLLEIVECFFAKKNCLLESVMCINKFLKKNCWKSKIYQ